MELLYSSILFYLLLAWRQLEDGAGGAALQAAPAPPAEEQHLHQLPALQDGGAAGQGAAEAGEGGAEKAGGGEET